MSDHRPRTDPIEAVAVITHREPTRGTRPWSRGARWLLAMAGLIVLDTALCRMSSASRVSPWSLTAVSVVSLAVACLIQFLLVEVHLTSLRCELDRRQKGEAWSGEGALSLSIYPALSLWMNSSGWTRFASTMHVLTVLSVCFAGNSATQLSRQIQRFSPGFSAPAESTAKRRRHLAHAALPAILIWNLLPTSWGWSTRLGAIVCQSWQELCRWIIGLVALPDAVDLLTAGLNSLGLMIALIVMSVWMSWTAPLVVSVLVHAHLSQQQGQRLARIRELLAGFTWMSLCLGLVGPEAFRRCSSLSALLCLGWVHAAYNPRTLDAYLRRMRQLR